MTIKNKDLTFISLRVLAIYIFIEAIINLSQIINFSVISNLSTFSELGIELNTAISSLLLGSLAPFFILLAISIILWVFTNKISNYLLSDNITDEDESEINLSNVQTMIFSVIGVLIIANTLPLIFNLISEIIKMNEFILATQFKTEIILSTIGIVVKLLIGFALIIWGKRLTKLLSRLG